MATIKQKKAVQKIIENHGNVSQGMIAAGYSKQTAKNPRNLTKSLGWKELMETYLSDELIAETHSKLLKASNIEHMVFPLDCTDEQIRDLLTEANCQIKRFMHSETQTHVWFFAADNNARKSALDMAYKLKGQYAAEKKDITSGGEPIKTINYIVPTDGINNPKTDLEATPSVSST